ncbi:hypothetical protein Nepgr_030957 [Nepenthes gracilis]|uniref:Uncharacterized protein n=1 Tax=Nepenthes gracilis TaxID=150966 RepID=A0AAD3Y6K4_NEPGR|nr:hypothetical protein Nepgr_030957 [Nepenthes gracilis]
MEGLDLHSQTREHQKKAMDMVLRIKQMTSNDRSSIEDGNKSILDRILRYLDLVTWTRSAFDVPSFLLVGLCRLRYFSAAIVVETVVQALEGTLSIKDLFMKEAPSHGRVHRSADYDSSQYGVDINKLWKLAFESQEQSIISEHGANPCPSTSSTENQHDTRDMEMGKMKDEYEIEWEIL